MEIKQTRIAPKLRTAGILIVLGLLVEIFTLKWNNPTAFLVFLGLGGLLILVGIVIYLLSLVSGEQTQATQEPPL
jgi:hypothetical protein